MKPTHIVPLMAMLLMSASAWAETGCLNDDGKPPPMALTGKLQTVRIVRSPFPAVSKDPFYVLDLDKPVCLNGDFSKTVIKNIRSVHVYSNDAKKIAMLKQRRGKHVSIQFASVFEEFTAHHHRPMVGEIETVTSLP